MSDTAPMTLDEVRTVAAGLVRTTGCGLPGCPGLIHFRTDVRGRRQRFCSGACRAKFSRERGRLHRLLGRVKDTYYVAEPPLPAKELDQLRDHLAWLLEAYGGVDDVLMHDGMSPLPFASWDEAMNHYLQVRDSQEEEFREIERLQAESPDDPRSSPPSDDIAWT